MGGGKGGVGKTMITANVGELLARLGRRVLLVDLDLGSPNLHTFMDRAGQGPGLEAFIERRTDDLGEVAVPTRVPNLSFIGSRNCSTEAANLHTSHKTKIINAIQGLDYDFILLDLGAGTHFNMLDFFLTSEQGICLLTSEPTAIENTFNFIKALYFRVVKRTLKLNAFKQVTRHIDLSGNSLDQSFKIIRAVSRVDHEMGDLLQAKLGRFEFKLMVNKVRENDDPELGKKVAQVCNRHFHSRFRFIGNVCYDQTVRDAILMRHNFISTYARSRAAYDLARVAANIMADADFWV